MTNYGERIRRRRRLLLEHPLCCFCGGQKASQTVDHVPPQACFPKGYFPEEHEFPACNDCNWETKQFDQVFALYSVLLDFDSANDDIELLHRLTQGVANNMPEALPDVNLGTSAKRDFLKRSGIRKPPGQLYRDLPLVNAPTHFRVASTLIARKLACALFFKEIKRIIPVGHNIIAGSAQIQNPTSRALIEFFDTHMAAYRRATRSNIKNYGERLSYKIAYNEADDLFGYAAQFGRGLFLWGISAENFENQPNAEIPIWTVGSQWLSSHPLFEKDSPQP